MAQGDVPTKPPTFTTRDWGAFVRKSWGDDWHKPTIAYKFSNGREFNDYGINRSVYAGVHPGDEILQENGHELLQQDGSELLQE